MRDILAYTMRLLKGRSVRSVLTIFQVALGIWAVSLIISANLNIRAQINQATAQYGQDLFVVSAGTSQEREDGSVRVTNRNVFTVDHLNQLKESSNIHRAYIVENLGMTRSLTVNGQSYRLQGLVGATADYPRAAGIEIIHGDTFTEMDVIQGNRVILISQTVARQLFPGESAIGKTLELSRGMGNVFRVTADASNQFEIIGVFRDLDELQSTFVDISHGIIPLGSEAVPVANTRTNARGAVTGRAADPTGFAGMIPGMDRFLPTGTAATATYHNLVIQAQPGQLFNAASDARVLLERALGENDHLSVEYLRDRNKELFATVNQVVYFLLAFGFIAVIISSVGILSVMLTSLVERIRAIGLHRALGASSRWIGSQFLLESVILSCVGAVLGLILAFLSANYVLESLLYKAFWADLVPSAATALHPLAILISFVSAILMGLAFGFFPAKEGAGMSPVEALRQG